MSKIRTYLGQISRVVTDRRSKWIAIVSGLAYLGFYFIITGFVAVFNTAAPFEFFINENWPALIFRERAPFNWEPIGFISLGYVQFFLAIPNIIFGGIVAALVGLNLSASAYTYLNRTTCRVDPSKSVLAAVPALLTGVACCGPSLLLSLGIASASVTVAFVSILPFMFPLALIGLVGSLLWTGKKLSE
ncbi:MAG: hypothetical protein ACW99U_04625 [Candidatus Thorarchaeota archaeon]